jgi:hypothetical protein
MAVPVASEHLLGRFMTCEANGVVEQSTPKRCPVILISPEESEASLSRRMKS